MVQDSSYSLTDIQQLLMEFQGSHYFHNYTARWSVNRRVYKGRAVTDEENSVPSGDEEQPSVEEDDEIDQHDETNREIQTNASTTTNESTTTNASTTTTASPAITTSNDGNENGVFRQTFVRNGINREVVTEVWGGRWSRSKEREQQMLHWRSPQSLRRRISLFTCTEEQAQDGSKWLKFQVTGSGFLWHQIRSEEEEGGRRRKKMKKNRMYEWSTHLAPLSIEK
jgi:hypothetical protein